MGVHTVYCINGVCVYACQGSIVALTSLKLIWLITPETQVRMLGRAWLSRTACVGYVMC